MRAPRIPAAGRLLKGGSVPALHVERIPHHAPGSLHAAAAPPEPTAASMLLDHSQEPSAMLHDRQETKERAA
jgi:hypothetical protein